MTRLSILSILILLSLTQASGRRALTLLSGTNQSHTAGKMNWWPASSVKIFVGLYAVRQKNSKLSKGTSQHLLDMLRWSSNKSFDHLVQKYSRDSINRWLAGNGYKSSFISVRYAAKGAFKGQYKHKRCRSTCTSLRDLSRGIKALSESRIGYMIQRKNVFYKEGYVRNRSYLNASQCKKKTIVLVRHAGSSYASMSSKYRRLIRDVCNNKKPREAIFNE